MLLDGRLMVLGPAPAPPPQDGTPRREGGGNGGDEAKWETGNRMSECTTFDSRGLNVRLSRVVVEGSFMEHPETPPPHSPYFCSANIWAPSLHLRLLCTTIQQPLIILHHINQCRQQRGRDREGWLVFQCCRFCLFMHLFMYLLGNAAHFSSPVFPPFFLRGSRQGLSNYLIWSGS